jgi:hypothetical protein
MLFALGITSPRYPPFVQVLSRSQLAALDRLRRRAQDDRPRTRERVDTVLARAGLPRGAARGVAARIREHARVTLNFHPDRPLVDGRTVAERLLAEGRYRPLQNLKQLWHVLVAFGHAAGEGALSRSNSPGPR